MKYDSFGSLRTAVKASGSHWFDPAAMRFFGTRTPADAKLWGGRIFIASHQAPDGTDDDRDRTRTIWGVHWVSRSPGGGILEISDPFEMLTDAPTNRADAEAIAEFLSTLDLPEVDSYEATKEIVRQVSAFRIRMGV